MFSDFSSEDEDQLYEYSPSFYYPLYSGYEDDGLLEEDFLGLPLEYISSASVTRRGILHNSPRELAGSLSRIESVFGGYDYECVTKPSEEFTCPICLLLMRDPVLTSCCGNHFCKSCNNESIKAKSKASKCPLCKSTSYTYLVDKGLQRKILDLVAYCPKKADGCDWQGEIRNVAKHINPYQDGCNYIEVKCRLGCDQKLVRHMMEQHISDDCPLRKITCQYCGYKGECESLLGPHLSECPEFPVSCPNKCTDSKMVRGKIHMHLEKDCPMETIGCLFENSGCTTKVLRKNMTEHIDNERLQHLMLLGKAQDSLKKELDKCNSKLAAYESENASLRAKVEELKSEVIMLKADKPSSDIQCDHDLLVAPCVLVLEKFEVIKRDTGIWNSPEFYSHSKGYKMQMTVFIDDSISLVIEMLEGKYDKYLCWPMKGNITVELLNVVDDNTHWIKQFTNITGYRVGRVIRANSPVVVECEWFTSCKYLKFFPPKNCQYLEDSKLRFRVSVNIDDACRPWLF